MKSLIALTGMFVLLQDSAIRVDVNLQQVVVTVRDENGRIVKGLRKDDFIVEEDGARQAISRFSSEPDAPISLGVLIDCTGSMNLMPGGTVTGVSGAVGLAYVLMGMLKSTDEVLLMSFSDNFQVKQPFTTERPKIDSALERILREERKGTSMLKVLPPALTEVKKAHNKKRALVVMTDAYYGGDLEAVARTVRGAEVPIFTFVMRGSLPGAQYPAYPQGCGSACHLFGGLPPRSLAPLSALPVGNLAGLQDRTTAFLETLSKESGGRSVLFQLHPRDSVARMRADLEEIAAELRGQYLLEYYSPYSDSARHSIRVRIANSSARAYVRRESLAAGARDRN